MERTPLSSWEDEEVEAEARLFEIRVLVSCFGTEEQKELFDVVSRLYKKGCPSYGLLCKAAKKLHIPEATCRALWHRLRKLIRPKCRRVQQRVYHR